MSREQLIDSGTNSALEFHRLVTFYFCFMNVYCRKNSALILCFVLIERDDCIALSNQV